MLRLSKKIPMWRENNSPFLFPLKQKNEILGMF